jgi:hypothetical protein
MISEISSLGLDAVVTWSTRLALALTLAAPAVIFLAVDGRSGRNWTSVKHSASGWTYYGDNWRPAGADFKEQNRRAAAYVD